MQNKILTTLNQPLPTEFYSLGGSVPQLYTTLEGLPLGTSTNAQDGELGVKVIVVGSSALTATTSGLATVAAPTYIEGSNNPISLDLTGRLRTLTFAQGLVADNAVASGGPVQTGGVAVTGSSYAPAYTAGDLAKLAVDKDSGGLLSHIRVISRTIDSIGADPKQLTTCSTATPGTADATLFTLAAGEKGFIQNLSADAPLAYKFGASASTSSFNGVLQKGAVADDGQGGSIVIDDWIGAVSVAKITGTARYIAFKLS